MKIRFENAEKLYTGIDLLKEDLDVELVSSGADLTVTVLESDTVGFTASLEGNAASITYGGGAARFYRALSTVVSKAKAGESFTLTERPTFKKNGSMVDMSRDSVMKVETVKLWLRKMALMGLNTFMLYTEDTYEIEGRPYFGHMRGRYTKNEIKEMDAYASALGIEMIPCIQMLGHLETHLKWGAAAPYKDTDRVLLVNTDETYRLIEDMIKTVKECFTSKKIHIGMDETHDLGRGAYIDKYGYLPHRDLYLAHLEKVVKLIRSYDLEPMMWSDMFFKMAHLRNSGSEVRDYEGNNKLLKEIAPLVPDGVQQVFWDYYHEGEDFYATNIENHKILCENAAFAGGVWAWGGHAVQLSRSLRNSIPALCACKKHGVNEVIATVWHNGAEACQIMALAGLAWYADFDYKGKFDEQSAIECFERATGACYRDFMETEFIEYPHGGKMALSRILLYNDPLLGLFDKHIEGHDTVKYYEDLIGRLENIGGGFYTEAFDVVRAVARVLLHKANFGVRLKSAYDKRDTAGLSALKDECGVIAELIEELRVTHRTAWYKYSKPFGFEVHDIRYGGIKARFDTVAYAIGEYLGGNDGALAELEEQRLTFDGAESPETDKWNFFWYRYPSICTTGTL